MRKVVAQVNGFEQELFALTKTERETLGEIGRLKNNLADEYDFYFRSKETETRADLPTGCIVRFDTVIVQIGLVQDIENDTLVKISQPKLQCRFLYTAEYESRVRGVTVNVTYDCEKTVAENIEYAYDRFLKIMDDIVDRDFTFWGEKREREFEYADSDAS